MSSEKQRELTAEAVQIRMEKKAGQEEWLPYFEAESVNGALYGLQVLIEEFCSLTGLTVERCLALLAARMLAGDDP